MSNTHRLTNCRFDWRAQGFLVTGICWEPQRTERSMYISYNAIAYFIPVMHETFDHVGKKKESMISIATTNGNTVVLSFDDPLEPVVERLAR